MYGIHEYVSVNFPGLAEDTTRRLYASCESLSRFPFKGRAGHQIGERLLPVRRLPYVIAYRVHSDAVEIIRIRHGAQDWQH